MGKLISLSDYRQGIRVEGTTLVWRGLRLRLSAPRAADLAEEIRDLLERPGTVGVSGFVVKATSETFTLEGHDMGPIILTRHEATGVALALALAVHPVARSL